MKEHGNVHEMTEWLSDPGSFMQRLVRHGVNDAQIRVLKEGWQLPARDEQRQLGLSCDADAWVREVSIYSEKNIWMYARTVIPQQTLTGEMRELQHLKDRSLGSILFQHPDMKRSEFKFFNVHTETECYKRMAEYLKLPDKPLHARQSQFKIKEKSLLLTEVFFPDVALL